MEYGLRQDHIAKIKNVFSQFPEIEEAVLYGSRAMGNFKNSSDIDLVLKGEKLNTSLLHKISLQLDDLLLPYTFDLSIYHRIDNEGLLEHIERVGLVFYKPTQS